MFLSAIILVVAEFLRQILFIAGSQMALVELYICMSHAVRAYCAVSVSGFRLLLTSM